MSLRNPSLPIVLAAAAALCIPMAAGAAKEQFQRTKPHVNIGIMTGDGLELLGFESVSGLGVEIEVLEDETTGRKRPGRTKFSNITLKRGYVIDASLQQWATEGLGGMVSTRDLRIDILSPSADSLASFNMLECFPTKWEVSAEAQGGAEETFVVTCLRVEPVR